MRTPTPMIGAGLALTCFTTASIGFYILFAVSGYVFGGFFRMYMYHEDHPLQYIAIVAIIFGLVGTMWHHYLGHTTNWLRWISILVALSITILIASVPGGILWKIHDMQAGYFPQGPQLWEDLSWGAKHGLKIGWFIILKSIPYNIFGIILGAITLHQIPEKIEAKLTQTNP